MSNPWTNIKSILFDRHLFKMIDTYCDGRWLLLIRLSEKISWRENRGCVGFQYTTPLTNISHADVATLIYTMESLV